MKIEFHRFLNFKTRKLCFLAFSLASLFWCCRSDRSSVVPTVPVENGKSARSIELGSLEVRDISGPGARLKGFDKALKQSLLSAKDEEVSIRLVSEKVAPMVVEVLNICAGGECQLVANATLSLPGDSGLRERYQALARVTLDGIDYKPHIPELSAALRERVFAELRARTATSAQISEWLKSGGSFEVDAAIRAVAARRLVDCASELALVLNSPDEERALLAVAAAGVLASSTLLAPLGEVALRREGKISDAAMQALADIGTAEARTLLTGLAQKLDGSEKGARAKELLEIMNASGYSKDDKLSP